VEELASALELVTLDYWQLGGLRDLFACKELNTTMLFVD
jgi:hypothetical protein